MKKNIIAIIAIIVMLILIVFIIVNDKNKFKNSLFGNMRQNPSDEQSIGAPPSNPGNQSSNVSYSCVREITSDETVNNETFSSTTSNQNGILANGNLSATLSNVKVEKTGDSDGGDSSNFYGNNSAILAKSGAKLTIKNSTISTKANGANGVFNYGGSATTNNSASDSTTINISDSTITTTGNNAGGIMTTGGGSTNASNLTINTFGTSSAAIRTDRGGGTVNVNRGTYVTSGKGSPSIYSTANIKVTNANLISKASEGVVIEGANSVSLDSCDLVDTNNQLNGQSTTYKNIFMYQSMSGDASSNGHSTFTSINSNITTNVGDTFYVTNTTAVINLTNNTIKNNDSAGNFLRIQKDSWGKSGSNGGNVTLSMNNQTASGNIVVDSLSTLYINMTNSSVYEGSINLDNSAKSISLKLDSTSKIKLTGDSYVTSIDDEDSSLSNIDFNGHKLYINGKSIN